MKKHIKQLLITLLALTLILSGSVCVQAKTISKPAQVLTLYSSKSLSYTASRRAFATANETALNTDVYMNQGVSSYKSSNTSVVSLVSRKAYPLYQKNPVSFSSYFMKAKKTGIAIISYKCGKNIYKQKVTVKKYVNPLSSLKIGSLNLTSKFNKNANYTLSYNKYKNKNIKLQVNSKNGWYVSGIRKINNPKGSEMGIWVKNGKTFKITKRNTFLTVYTYNQKTTQTEECTIIFK